MGSSDGVGNSNNSSVDQIGLAKEQFQNRENELVRRQKRQLVETEKAHQKEVTALKESHDEILKETRENYRRVLSEKEVEFQKEIQKMQELNRSRKAQDKEKGKV